MEPAVPQIIPVLRDKKESVRVLIQGSDEIKGRPRAIYLAQCKG